MKFTNLIITTLVAGAMLLPASLLLGAERQWGSVKCNQFLATPKVRSTKSTLEFYMDMRTLTADIAADGFNIISGDSYQINNTSVLNATTLGSGVTASSLTSHGNQTRKITLLPKDFGVLAALAPTITVTVGGTGNNWQVAQFDGDGGSTGDNHVFFPWHIPDGYVTDSASLNIIWSCESAETSGDTLTLDGSVLSVASGEAVDATATGMTAVVDTQWTGSADLVFTTVLDPEVLVIAVDDTAYFDIFVDESGSAFADSVDIHAIEIEWETTE